MELENSMLNPGYSSEVTSDSSGHNFMQQGLHYVGLSTPFQRFIFGFTIAETVVMIAKPSFAFKSNGSMRPIKFLGSVERDATYMPWFAPGLLIGSALALFF